MSAKCRDCGQSIMFVRMVDGGKAVPVDPYPDPDGNVYARHVSPPGGLLGHVAHKDEPQPEGHGVYMPHFATCPARQKSPESVESAPAEPDPEPTLFGPTEGTQP